MTKLLKTLPRSSLKIIFLTFILSLLASCGSLLSTKPTPKPTSKPAESSQTSEGAEILGSADGSVIKQNGSRWIPVLWSDLPGLENDTLTDAWSTLLRNCERPVKNWADVCAKMQQVNLRASEFERRQWVRTHLQPYRVESHNGISEGVLTSYYEPVIVARRKPNSEFRVPLYKVPSNINSKKPWFTRQQIESDSRIRASLNGTEIAWLNDPVEAMVLHIQGSGRLQITEANGSESMVRVAFAATNEHPFRGIGRWLQNQGVKDVSWTGIRRWLASNPKRENELMWSNPRYVFFKEEALTGDNANNGPRGAQGVPLTPMRSIAVDRNSIPYGTPVWLASDSPSLSIRRWVVAQDTGSAIVGAVRADYYAGSGSQAGEFAGRVKQPLRMWVLWPR